MRMLHPNREFVEEKDACTLFVLLTRAFLGEAMLRALPTCTAAIGIRSPLSAGRRAQVFLDLGRKTLKNDT